MKSLRIDGESDEEFTARAETAAKYARLLISACFRNRWVRTLLEDENEPLWTKEAVLRNPTVRVEYEEAIAFGGVGETFAATRNKHWGNLIGILPLEEDDWFYPERISYLYKPESKYNRRFEQRKRMKELLGKRYRPLVERAKYKRHTQAIFLEGLKSDEMEVIRRVFDVDPRTFWRACRGKVFLDLPPRMIQLELDFDQ